MAGDGGRPLSARERLAAELQALHIRGGNRTYSAIAKHARAQTPSFSMSTSSIGEWLNGKSVPQPPAKLKAFVTAMADTTPDALLRRYYHEALREGHGPAVTRPAPGQPGVPPPSHIPHLDALHYVDVDRLYDLLAGQRRVVPLPNQHRRGLEHAAFRQRLVAELEPIAVRAKRFNPDLQLRQLTDGVLLIFDTQVRTRNGVSPGQQVELTGDLNLDPHIYIQRRGVRILMSLKPEMITTQTAFGYFSSGIVQLAGICRIKYRVSRAGRSTMPETDKVQYLATPLVLGTVHPADTHNDLRASPLFEALDSEYDGMRTIGPWEWVDETLLGSD